jgi:hypothetical protein
MYVGIFYFSKSIFHYNLCFKVIRTSGLLPLSNPLFYRWYHFPTELIITVDYDGVRFVVRQDVAAALQRRERTYSPSSNTTFRISIHAKTSIPACGF